MLDLLRCVESEELPPRLADPYQRQRQPRTLAGVTAIQHHEQLRREHVEPLHFHIAKLGGSLRHLTAQLVEFLSYIAVRR